ncbi:MAG: DUF58 domain-containing protein [Actinomycetota bacterium]|nr:DUF58 domain-containing protein [Actinomycetota bacterium]
MTDAEGWRPTPAHLRAVVGGGSLAVAAVMARRPDLLVLAVPLLGAAVMAAARRPEQAPVVTQSIDHGVLREGDATTWRIAVADPEGRVEDVAALLDEAAWTDRQPATGQVAVALHADGDEALAIAIRSSHWGRRRVGPAVVVASSAWAGFRWVGRDEADARLLVTLPQPSPFDAVAPPVRTPGLVGLNRSPRGGSGTEFASVRPFQPGDRLRRVHWPQSLRTGTLHVTSTWADQDRHVVLMVDALTDVGVSGGIDGRASSLDVSVRATSSVAEYFISHGDRVGLVVLSARGVRRLAAAAGHRHLRRVLEVLASIERSSSLVDDGRMPRVLGEGALVVLLSPLLSPASLQRAATIADRGLQVLVIDCLPEQIAEWADEPLIGMTWRIELLKRERELGRARAAGVAVVPWHGPGSLDAVLRDAHHSAGRGRHR